MSNHCLNEHPGLVVAVGGEGLGLPGGDGRVPLDERRHHPARRLNAEGERRDVQQQEVLHRLGLVAGQDGGLDGGAVGHRLVRIDGLVQLLAAEEVLGSNKNKKKRLENL